MTLDPLASHPSGRSYVLKLHRDARPQQGLLFGRLESMAGGHSFAFANADELLRCLALDASQQPDTADPVRLGGR
jgi:hypothetical protein